MFGNSSMFTDPGFHFGDTTKPAISLGNPNAGNDIAAGSGAFHWDVLTPDGVTSAWKTAATAAQAKADALAYGTAKASYPFNWQVQDDSGNVVDYGTVNSTDNGQAETVKFRVNVTDDAGAYIWSSGYIYDSLEGAKAGLEAQRGSFEAGKTFKYAIYDHASVVVDSGTVSSTAYVPDDTNYFIRIHNELTNTDEPDDNTPYSTLEAAKVALPGKESALKAKSPTQGKYDWWILKAGQSVADGVFIWGFGTPPTPPVTPPGSIFDGIPQEAVMAVIAVIVIVAIIAVVMSVGGI
jgi:hypothetical protein